MAGWVGGGVVHKEWVEELGIIDILKFFKPPFKLDGDKIYKKIKSLVGEYKIEDLDIKFTAVAVDLNKKREVWFQKGDMWSAIKASSAIPGIFDSIEYKGMRLVDGGVLNLMPIAPVMSDMSDLIVAVNLYGENIDFDVKINKKAKEKTSILEEIWSKLFENDDNDTNLSIDLMMSTIFRYRKAEYVPDIEITFPENIAKWYEFYRAVELIEIGRVHTRKILDIIHQKKGD